MQLKNPILGLCQQSTFMLSAAKVDQCPDDEGFEVASPVVPTPANPARSTP
jgi:GTP-binding protein